ncbi:hypothetical protein K505DRAFT_96146 [Melanomma pulvis-pyrius CBS 109.77]|uniref:Zn(2)-C6 fungal-type domain-containing protein n=1 Tax=Melanomma pulvis-pyrius CBS 109.77 TaxID=1314802 RepID=A0A6A6XRT1_9PLEO|nr:hypothetical protein K505DRAFT_96146 [Melanomma pulvis-pyrius CBS 109.77]
MPSDARMVEPDLEIHHQRKADLFLSHVQLSRLQSEIHGVQFFDQILPEDTPDYGDWICKMENSVQEWQERLSSDGDIPGWSINAANHCRLLLYRPCSRNIVPSESGLRAASSVSIRTINGYWALVQAGSLIFSFQYVFNVFQAGMVLLYALGDHGPIELGFALEEEANEAIGLLVPLFDALSAKWPAATDTGHYVKELKDIIQGNLDAEPMPGRSAYDINLIAELDFMVTQRRIHSVYHRNIEVLRPDEMMNWDLSPWAHAESLTPLRDELWQEIFNTGFEFLADDALVCLEDEHSSELDSIMITDPSLKSNMEPESAIDVELLFHSLPACGFCRGQHIRCDRKFPSCGACAKSNRECVFYDAVLQRDILRNHVYDLYERFKAITGETTTNFPRHNSGAEPPAGQSLSHGVFVPCYMAESRKSGPKSVYEEWDQIFVGLNNWYFGPASAFVWLEHALSFNPESVPPPHNYEEWKTQLSLSLIPHFSDLPLPPRSVSTALFALFARSMNVFYPTVSDPYMDTLIINAYSNQESPMATHEEDIFYLILAIGSKLSMKSDPGLALGPQVYFHKATYHPERSRDGWLHLDQLLLLQRNLLICTYLLLSPAAGDIWRNLGFAIRLYFDLSHRPSTNDDMNEGLMCMLFRTLYTLECQVSIAFGRPSLLVIGDKLRIEMTEPMSGTVEERISCYSYRISLLKMQIHSYMLSNLSKQPLQTVAREIVQTYRLELKAWLTDWKEEVVPMIESDPAKATNSRLVLDSWADLNYHHAELLLNQLPPTNQTAEALLNCHLLVRSCSALARHQQKSLLPRGTAEYEQQRLPIFPLSWTTAHLIFSIGLNLRLWGFQRGATADSEKRLGISRRCLTLLALLEGDPMMLSTGFSVILEGLLYEDEVHGDSRWV